MTMKEAVGDELVCLMIKVCAHIGGFHPGATTKLTKISLGPLIVILA